MKAEVNLTGRLTRDVVNVFSNDDGSAERVLFTVAVNSFTNNNNTKKEVTDFIPCIEWNKSRANLLMTWGKKGRLVHIRGVLDTFQGSPNDDGEYPPVRMQVRVRELEFLDRKPETPIISTEKTKNESTNNLETLASLVAKAMLNVTNKQQSVQEQQPVQEQQVQEQQVQEQQVQELTQALQGLI